MDLREKALLRDGPGVRHPWEQARLSLLEHWLEEFSLADGAILDVGCGDAYLLKSLAASRPSRVCLGVDSAHIGPATNSVYSTLDEVPSLPRGAAAVLLMDVLEHVEDDAALLLDLRGRGLISRDTLVVITVPAHPPLFSSHDTFLGHYRRYTLSALGAVIERARLRPHRLGYLFSTLLALRLIPWFFEALEIYRPAFSGVTNWRGSPWLSRQIARALYLDARTGELVQRCTGVRVPGLSCYALCGLL